MQVLSVDQLVGRALGEYQLERLLGHGQLSAVYMAQHKSQGRTVMVTTFNFPDSIAVRERFAERFAQEGAALVGLKHPNILSTYDFGEQAGFPYLVTAFGFCEGSFAVPGTQAANSPDAPTNAGYPQAVGGGPGLRA
ncbi:MAG: hypothetical protein E6I32_01330 [Chloroflexi bacterium]|nr:MAG: hypothetical protein E6I32_01330 [Chloroflexota bacterium]